MNRPNIAKSKELLIKVRSFKSRKSVISYLKKIDNYLMEELVLSSLEAQGHSITRSARYSGDGGKDGEAIIYGKPYYIQTKRYTDHISKKHVADFIRLCNDNKVNGLFVHTGITGRSTRKLSNGSKAIHMISGDKLYRMIIGRSFGVRRTPLYIIKKILISIIFKDS